MEKHDIFRDIAERTGGDIYLGVVGPVRTGKSTFIKKFMELLVIPNIKNPSEKDRAKDELPQGGAGRTIMTTEPKFVPDEAVEITVREGLKMKVRMVDCVGYTVEGALGYEEDGETRMVRTPWFEEAIPFQQAAEFGTRKVIADHSTIGLVVTTDGTITEIPRENYVDAEERVIWELKELQKPFLVLLNSSRPYRPETTRLAEELEQSYGVRVLPVDCAQLTQEDIMQILEAALYEFPVTEVNVNLPKWIEELESSHWLRQKFEDSVREAIVVVKRLRDIDGALKVLAEHDFVENVSLQNMDLGSGAAFIEVSARRNLFYETLEEVSGLTIRGDHHILRQLRELSQVKREYDRFAAGLQEVKNMGYGIVPPTVEEMELAEPELVRQGNRFGVKLRASAFSYHFIRASVATEITPVIGTERQCEELLEYLLEEFQDNPQKIWGTNIFGKSLYELAREGIQGKIFRMPENAQVKLQETLERIINEGSGGLICIII